MEKERVVISNPISLNLCQFAQLTSIPMPAWPEEYLQYHVVKRQRERQATAPSFSNSCNARNWKL